MAQRETLKVFYDGGCRVCDSEISVYKKTDQDANLEFVDINAADFDAKTFGKNRDEFMQALHVMDETGQFHVGVDAFRLLWRRLPGVHYQLLATMSGLPGINLVARIGYRVFAENRHRLPRKEK